MHMKRRKRHLRGPNDVHSIESFCESNGISVTTYFALKKAGKGPREMKVNKRILITPEAEADWRRAREADSIAAKNPQ
jgi:hypothetical protein